HAERTPDRFAVRDSRRRLTYRQLISSVDALAADLATRGVRSGQRVAVWLPSRIESAIVLLACSRNGYICCPSLHRDHSVGEIIDLIRRMEAAVVFAEVGYGADSSRHDVFASLAGLEFVKHIYRLTRLNEGVTGAMPFDDALKTAPSVPAPA